MYFYSFRKYKLLAQHKHHFIGIKYYFLKNVNKILINLNKTINMF